MPTGMRDSRRVQEPQEAPILTARSIWFTEVQNFHCSTFCWERVPRSRFSYSYAWCAPHPCARNQAPIRVRFSTARPRYRHPMYRHFGKNFGVPQGANSQSAFYPFPYTSFSLVQTSQACILNCFQQSTQQSIREFFQRFSSARS